MPRLMTSFLVATLFFAIFAVAQLITLQPKDEHAVFASIPAVLAFVNAGVYFLQAYVMIEEVDKTYMTWFALALAAPAQSAPSKFLFAGGATFPEKTYRDIMNCYGVHSGTDTEIGLTSHTCNTTDKGFKGSYTTDVQVLYAGVGSGNGRKALRNHTAGNPGGLTDGGTLPDSVPVPSTADSGAHYGTATGDAWAPTKSTANPFPATRSKKKLTRCDLFHMEPACGCPKPPAWPTKSIHLGPTPTTIPGPITP